MAPHAQPAKTKNSNPASLLKRIKGSVQNKSTTRSHWYMTCFSGGGKTEKADEPDGQPAAAQIREFLSTDSPSKQHKPLQRPQAAEYLAQLPFEARPTTSLSKYFGRPQSAGKDIVASSSGISLSSTLAGSALVNEWEKPLFLGASNDDIAGVSPQRQPGRVKAIETPDDFNQFTSDLSGRTELESNPVMTGNNTRRGPSQVVTSRHSAAVATRPFVGPLIDPTPIPVSASDAGPSGRRTVKQFKAYPGGIKVSYVPPKLQAGWAGGVPPMLRAGHGERAPGMRNSTTDISQAGHAKADGSTDSAAPRYSWPLVDFDQEMFLNSNPSEAGHGIPRRRHPKYQEPRIPSMNFSEMGLEREVTAMLGNLQHEKKQHKQVNDYQRQQQRRASVQSPVSAASDNGNDMEIHEMEASTEHPHGRSLPRQHMRNMTVSPISPECTEDSHQGRVVSHYEYNWPRFSDVQEYQDPAEEYSRRYRDRRREARRSRE